MSAAESPDSPPAARPDAYFALRFRDFRLLFFSTLFSVIAEQMLGAAIAWELYARTKNPFDLGLVGLVQIIPVLLLALPAGHIADTADRKRVVVLAMSGLALCSLALAALSWAQGPIVLIYLCILGMGIGRAFQSPAFSALQAQVVPAEAYANAATWQSTAWQLSAILGPALGGLLLALPTGATLVYILSSVTLLGVALALSTIRAQTVALGAGEPMTMSSMLAGLRFVWQNKIILASISLDMFAVLFGGAVALLPVYASDVLHVGELGYGVMRAAPSIGAVAMAFLIAHMPPMKNAGRALLYAVAGFGIATLVFGVSTFFPLSLAMLVVLGALDNISVVIRSTLLLTRTPDEMRGRVNAVHYVFVGISNELGSFESGTAAALLGSSVAAVVFGGFGTLAVVVLIALAFPELRRLGRLVAAPAA